MISSSEALKKVVEHSLNIGEENIALELACWRILSKDVISLYDHPFFDHSAVDGYTFRFSDLDLSKKNQSGLEIIGEIPAGANPSKLDSPGTCYRIFTGAAIPEGADTIVMQELTERKENHLWIKDEKISLGGNVRKMGEQIKQGEVALKKGTKLSPELISFLASIGIQEVSVSKKPRIAVLVTGSEFIEPGQTPGAGKIFESNGILLVSWLNKLGYKVDFTISNDDPENLKKEIQRMASIADVLIVTGGASVGDYDFTPEAIASAGLKTVFHKVNQKPGKPFLFCANENMSTHNKVAFGLPGNPLSAIMCFLVYIVPFLDASEGKTNPGFNKILLPLSQAFSKKDGKTHFKTVGIENGKLVIMAGQASHMLRSFDGAVGVGIFPDSKDEYKEGEWIEVLLTNAL